MSKAKGIMRHRRVEHPMPTGERWKIGCSCGWSGYLELAEMAERTLADTKARLDQIFVDHVPEAKRRMYVLVDQRVIQAADPEEPGSRDVVGGNWIMPEGVACQFDTHWEADGFRYVHLVKPIDEVMIVGEVRTADGHIYRLE